MEADSDVSMRTAPASQDSNVTELDTDSEPAKPEQSTFQCSVNPDSDTDTGDCARVNTITGQHKSRFSLALQENPDCVTFSFTNSYQEALPLFQFTMYRGWMQLCFYDFLPVETIDPSSSASDIQETGPPGSGVGRQVAIPLGNWDDVQAAIPSCSWQNPQADNPSYIWPDSQTAISSCSWAIPQAAVPSYIWADTQVAGSTISSTKHFEPRMIYNYDIEEMGKFRFVNYTDYSPWKEIDAAFGLERRHDAPKTIDKSKPQNLPPPLVTSVGAIGSKTETDSTTSDSDVDVVTVDYKEPANIVQRHKWKKKKGTSSCDEFSEYEYAVLPATVAPESTYFEIRRVSNILYIMFYFSLRGKEIRCTFCVVSVNDDVSEVSLVFRTPFTEEVVDIRTDGRSRVIKRPWHPYVLDLPYYTTQLTPDHPNINVRFLPDNEFQSLMIKVFGPPNGERVIPSFSSHSHEYISFPYNDIGTFECFQATIQYANEEVVQKARTKRWRKRLVRNAKLRPKRNRNLILGMRNRKNAGNRGSKPKKHRHKGTSSKQLIKVQSLSMSKSPESSDES